MQYQNETPQDYYERTGRLPDSISQPGGANQLVDSQGRPWGPWSTGPSYYMGTPEDVQRAQSLGINPVSGNLFDSNDTRVRNELFTDQTNNGQNGWLESLQTKSPIVLGGAFTGAALGGAFGGGSIADAFGGTGAATASTAAPATGGLGSVAPEYSLGSTGTAPAWGGGGSGIGTAASTGAGTFSATSPFTLAGGATGAAAVAGGGAMLGSGGSLWTDIFKPLLSGAAGLGGGAQTVGGSALSTLIYGLLESNGRKDLADALRASTAGAVNKADPFSSQYGIYQPQLATLWGANGPQAAQDYLSNTAGYGAAMQGIRARNAKLGDMFSGEGAIKELQTGVNAQESLSKTLAPLAGNFGPGSAGTIAANGGTAAAQADNQAQAGLGYAFRPIVNKSADFLANQIFV